MADQPLPPAEVLNDPHTPVWDMLAYAGITLDQIGTRPDGTWHLTCPDGGRLAFGPATTETGDAAPGWDWTRYDAADEITAQDHAPDDATLLGILAGA